MNYSVIKRYIFPWRKKEHSDEVILNSCVIGYSSMWVTLCGTHISVSLPPSLWVINHASGEVHTMCLRRKKCLSFLYGNSTKSTWFLCLKLCISISLVQPTKIIQLYSVAVFPRRATHLLWF